MAHAEPGDRIILRVLGEPLLNDTATVDERGLVTLPKLGAVRANTLPIAAFRDSIREQIGRFIRGGTIDVMILRRVIVSGDVEDPGVYYAELTSTVGEMIAQAGGLKETAHPGRVSVMRAGEKIPVQDWQSTALASVDLRSGDQIVVGRRSWLALNLISVVSVGASLVALAISIAR